MIRFYGHPLSDNARKVHWALEELGVPYEHVVIDLLKGEHRQPQFMAKNPLGRVPIIEDDAFTMSESVAILQYLGERYGSGKLVPESTLERAELQQWLAYQACHYGPALEKPWRMKIVSPLLGEPHDDISQQKLCAEAVPWLSRLDAHLAGREYVVGKRFSIADIALAEPTTLAEQAGIDLAKWPAVKAWLVRLSQRPAFHKTRPQVAQA